MKKLSAFFLASFFLACAKGGGENPDTAGYRDPGGLFQLAGPTAWRVMEKTGGAQRVSFFGPPSGPKPYNAMISIYHYGNAGDYRTPKDYMSARTLNALTATPPVENAHGAGSLEFSSERASAPMHGLAAEKITERAVLIPGREGFFALIHSAPTADASQTRPAFEQILKSFRTQ